MSGFKEIINAYMYAKHEREYKKMEYDINEMYSTWENITGHAPNDSQKRLIQAVKNATDTTSIDVVIALLEKILDIKKDGGNLIIR